MLASFRPCFYDNTEYKVEGENCDDGDQPGEEDQDWQGRAEITEYWPLLSSTILYLLVQKFARAVCPDHDGLNHRYGGNSG